MIGILLRVILSIYIVIVRLLTRNKYFNISKKMNIFNQNYFD